MFRLIIIAVAGVIIFSCSNKQKPIYHQLSTRVDSTLAIIKSTNTEIDTSAFSGFILKKEALSKIIDSCLNLIPKKNVYADSLDLLESRFTMELDTLIAKKRADFLFNVTDPIYKNVPWGARFNDFAKFKGISTKYGEQTGTIIKNAQTNTSISVMLGGTASYYLTNYGDRDISISNIPSKFFSVYVDSDDVTYIFYDTCFAMAYSELVAKNYNSYYSMLSTKYRPIGATNETVPSPEATPDQITGELFKKGKVQVILFKTKRTFSEDGVASNSLGVLYIYDDFYARIRSEIDKAIKEKENRESHNEQQNLKEDLNKLR